MTSVPVSVLSSVIAPAAKPSTASKAAEKAGSEGASGFSATLHKIEKASSTKTVDATKPSGKKGEEHTNQVVPVEDFNGTQPAPGALSGILTTEPVNQGSAAPVNAPPVIETVALDKVTPTVTGLNQAVADLNNESLAEGEQRDIAADEVAPSAAQPAVLALPDGIQAVINTVMPAQAQASQDRQTEAPIEKVPLATSIIASINMGKALEKSGESPAISLLNDAGEPSKEFSGVMDIAQSKTQGQQSNPPVDAAIAKPTVTSELPVKLKAEPESPVVTRLSADDKNGVSVSSAVPATATAPAQPASISSNPNGSAILQTPVTNQDWAKHLGQQLVNFHIKGDQNIQLHLNPANLGPMSITLNVNEHLQATAHFSSHSSQVRSALEQGINQLRESMAEQGISLGDTSVGEQRQQGFSQNNNGRSPALSSVKVADDHLKSDVSPGVTSPRAPGNGEISTYA